MIVNNDFNSFCKKIKKVYNKRNRKLKNFDGSRSIYRLSSKDSDVRLVSEYKFEEIIKKMNACLAEDLSLGKPIDLPFLGQLYIINYKPSIYCNDGMLKVIRKIDWKETHKLWYEDKNAMNNKTLLYINDDIIYSIKWKKNKFKNNLAYRFAPLRRVKIMLKDNIKNGVSINSYHYGK